MLCAGTGCVSNGAFKIKQSLESELEKHNLQDEVGVVMTGCNGFCAQGPVAVVKPDETARDVANFPLVRDERRLDEDAPVLVHIVDVRPHGVPDEVAVNHLAFVLQHVTRLRPQPHALVIAGV